MPGDLSLVLLPGMDGTGRFFAPFVAELPAVGRLLSSFRHVIGSWCFRFAPPFWLIRRYLAGDDAPAELVAAVRSAVAAVAPAVMATRIQEVLAVEDRKLLTAIRVPVLCLLGSRDRLIARTRVEDFQSLGRTFQTASIDAPHMILQTQPAAAARLIEQFLKTESTVGGPLD
jgi:pimeloyl-[acyl-carrier protein] methyl ester esterase